MSNCVEQISGAGGAFSIPVIAGKYWLFDYDSSHKYAEGFFSVAGFTYNQAAADPVDATSADAVGIVMVLPAAIHVTVTLTNTDGQPVQGVGCYVVNGIQSGVLSNSGGVCVQVLRPGSFQVWFQDPNMLYRECYYAASGACTTDWGSMASFTVTATSADFNLATVLTKYGT